MDLNRATLLGRLSRDPEVRNTPGGATVASFSVATGRVWTDQSGNKQEKTEFHNCVVWGKLAEIAGQYLSKGRRVYIEGRLETRDWTGQDGVRRFRTEVIVDNFIMLDGPRGTNTSQPAESAGSRQALPVVEVPEEEIKVEDIPF
ncbi:MAG TPA: single-stranded DNA-binding protein [Patescibacteria group bacterium]|nr:single-stranded DNA-binding protein [Patescibacteria group bacterium]